MKRLFLIIALSLFAFRGNSQCGIITTVVGTGVSGSAGDGGAATLASISSAYAIKMDAAGNMYIADYNASVVRKVTSGGIITTIAGNGTQGYSGDGGPATAAQLFNPSGIALDGAGNLYIAEYNNHTILKVDTAGIIRTVAGNNTAGSGYSGDGYAATDAQLSFPRDVAVDGTGRIFIADANNSCVRKVNTSGIITTLSYHQGSGFSTYFN